MPSTTIGIWVENGSRYETAAQAGISHYLEHLFFKGTERRTATQIAEEFDAVGGVFNAFTGKETTCYYAKVLGEHLPVAQDILGDIMLHSSFAPDEIDRERNVILQEIRQGEDNPDEHIHDLFNSQYWPGHPLSRPVCGREETVSSFTQQDFLDFVAMRYRPNRITIAAAGCVKHAEIVEWATATFDRLEGCAEIDRGEAPTAKKSVQQVDKALEQVHICMGIPGISHLSQERFAAYLMNTALGGGMSSRLFQEIREKRGRAYSVYSFLSAYHDAGYWGTYIGTGADHVREVISLVIAELMKIKSHGLQEGELDRTKNQLKGSLLMGLETTDSRMTRLARNEIHFGQDIPPSEIAQRIEETTNDDIVELAGKLIDLESMAITVLGNTQGQSIDENLLAAA